jgi:hypothetical protein
VSRGQVFSLVLATGTVSTTASTISSPVAGRIGTVIFHQSSSYLLKDRNGIVHSEKAFEKDAPYILQRENLDRIVAYLTKLRQSVDTGPAAVRPAAVGAECSACGSALAGPHLTQ